MDFGDQARSIWAEHGGQSIRPLVEMLGSGVAEQTSGEIDELNFIAFGMLGAHLDFAATARTAGWYYEAAESEWRITDAQASDGYRYAATADFACIQDGIRPEPSDIFELHAVSEWLGERLSSHGEQVTLFGGLTVWKRDASASVYDHPSFLQLVAGLEPDDLVPSHSPRPGQ